MLDFDKRLRPKCEMRTIALAIDGVLIASPVTVANCVEFFLNNGLVTMFLGQLEMRRFTTYTGRVYAAIQGRTRI